MGIGAIGQVQEAGAKRMTWGNVRGMTRRFGKLRMDMNGLMDFRWTLNCFLSCSFMNCFLLRFNLMAFYRMWNPWEYIRNTNEKSNESNEVFPWSQKYHTFNFFVHSHSSRICFFTLYTVFLRVNQAFGSMGSGTMLRDSAIRAAGATQKQHGSFPLHSNRTAVWAV